MKRVEQKLAILGAALLLIAIIADPATAVIWELDCDSGAVFTWQAVVTDSAGDPIPSGDYELIYCYYEDSAGFNLIGCCTTIATVGTPSRGSGDDKAAFGGSALAELTYAQPIWEDTTKVGHFPKMTVMPDIWLELTFNGETMSPLTLVTSVPNSGTAQRVLGDIYTAPGRALIVEPPQASSGMVDILGNDTVASVGIYRPTDDILPMIIMEVTDTTSILAVFDTSRNTTISITGEGAGTFDDLVWSKTGFKFPDLTIQTTAWTGGAASGWVDDGTVVRLDNVDDSIGIGTTSPSEKLEVSGNLRVTGKANIGPGNSNAGRSAFVAGEGNSASGDSSVVSGGANNTASGNKSTVGGGHNNTASNDRSVVSGGYSNTASGFDATVSGGLQNTADGTSATVGGGSQNSAPGQDATVSGGDHNTASGIWSTVGGGTYNEASTKCATIGGGLYDTSKAVYGGVSAGYSNLGGNDISDTAAYVGGGLNNSATSPYAAVAAGHNNAASGRYSVISGGFQSTASGEYSTVGGGRVCQATAKAATVPGGWLNTASGEYSTVSGGAESEAVAHYSVVGGGRQDTAKALFGGVSAGYRNLAGDETTDTAAYVGGGLENAAKAKYATVCGGRLNVADSSYSTVGGGLINSAIGIYSSIGGGNNNTASGYYSSVGGGNSNTASGHYSSIGGGYNNTASGYPSSIGGGDNNTADSAYSVVCGGWQNSAGAIYAVILGGSKDTLTSLAHSSMAFGHEVYVNNSYRVVFFDGSGHGRLGINRDDHDSAGIGHPIHVGTNTSNGNGAYLSSGGAWTDGSSRKFKENFKELDGMDVLDRIGQLPIESWEYKGTGERHIWPCAEDFHKQFDVGVLKEDGTRDNEYLAAGDVAGVALAGVKELAKENQELRERIEQLEALVETLLAQQDGSNEPKAEFGMNK